MSSSFTVATTNTRMRKRGEGLAEGVDVLRERHEYALDEFQRKAVQSFKAGKHVAVLGGAGTGKSFVVSKIIAAAKEKYGERRVAACAGTNNAAKNIGGVTLHRLFGAKINWEWSGAGLWNQVSSSPDVKRALADMDVLIIDEISTVKSSVLESIDAVLRKLVAIDWLAGLPFGGRLIVVSGDPFQLGPVFLNHETEQESAIDSRPWDHCFGPDSGGVIVLLPQNHRQSSDSNFYGILSRLRVGKQTEDDIRLLNETSKKGTEPPDTYVRLVLTNKQAADINRRELSRIPSEIRTLEACDTIVTRTGSPSLYSELQNRLQHAAPKRVLSKVGARVILTCKVNEYYPGTEMRVIAMEPCELNNGKHQTFSVLCQPFRYFNESENERPSQLVLSPLRTPIHNRCGELLAFREQIPVVPAYALTIHRSQSLSLDRVAVNFSSAHIGRNPFPGAVYVALSRCKTLSGLWIRGLRQNMIVTPSRAKMLLEQISKIEEHYPSKVVRNKNISMDSAEKSSKKRRNTPVIHPKSVAICKRSHKSYQTTPRKVLGNIQPGSIR